MTTLGWATRRLRTAGERLSQEMAFTAPEVPARVGYTSSSTPSLRESSSSMGAESLPMATTGSAVVAPSFPPWVSSTSPVSSATRSPGREAYQGAPALESAAKPMPLPKAMFITASAAPFSTAQAAFTLPALWRAWNSGPLPVEQVHRVARLLKLGGEHLPGLHRGDGEGDHRGGHVQIQEGAGHGVLAADGRRPQLQLGVQGTQQGGEGLAPPLRLGAQFLKELLQGEIGGFVVRAGGHQLGHRGVHRAVGAGIGIRGRRPWPGRGCAGSFRRRA